MGQEYADRDKYLHGGQMTSKGGQANSKGVRLNRGGWGCSSEQANQSYR